MAAVWEKMSKSKNNSVSVDEVTNCITTVAPGWCFIDRDDNVVDLSVDHVYRNQNDGFFYTQKTKGHRPVFLVERQNMSVLPDLMFGESVVNQFDHWNSFKVRKRNG
jgi:hypothetical protein